MDAVLVPFLFVACAGSAAAQALDPIYVSDNAGDKIWKVADLNGDGDYDDAGELSLFYDDTWPGALSLTTNSGIKMARNGAVYVCDLGEKYILALVDLNGDGACDDPGEARIFFDGRAGGNASGVLMTSGNNFCIDAQGRFWIASANNGGGGVDAILEVADLDGDGDANDAGEALEYYKPAPGGAVGDSIPEATAIGADGRVYYTESGSTGVLAKGVYRLDDLDNSGTIDQPGEATPFFIPPPQAATAFFFDLRLGPGGWLYLSDTGNELIWRCKDLNADGDALDAGESQIVWSTAAGTSLLWDLAFASDGALVACESQAPDRLLRMFDANTNGTYEPGEVTEVYSDLLSPTDIGDPRAMDFALPATLGGVACPGDNTNPIPCPCGNTGASGHGCENSGSTGGGLLRAYGTTSPDTVVFLSTSELASAPSILLQGTSALPSSVPFGDGLRCVGGSLKRLYVKSAVAGGLSAPAPGDPSITARSAALGDPIAPGSFRGYQVYYRDPDPIFCPIPTGNTWNATETLFIGW